MDKRLEAMGKPVSLVDELRSACLVYDDFPKLVELMTNAADALELNAPRDLASYTTGGLMSVWMMYRDSIALKIDGYALKEAKAELHRVITRVGKNLMATSTPPVLPE